MLTEPARVLTVSGDMIQLETSRKAACGKCSIKSGCGQHLFGSGTEILQLSRQAIGTKGAALLPGTRVTLCMHQGAVASLALLFYSLPLVLLLAFTLLAGIWTTNEGVLILSSFTGLSAGLLLLPAALRILSVRLPCSPVLGRSEYDAAMISEYVDAN